MAKQFHGSFIFTRQGYGILSGVYNNNIAPEPFPPLSVLIIVTIAVPLQGVFTCKCTAGKLSERSNFNSALLQMYCG